MNGQFLAASEHPSTVQRLLPAVLPVLLIAIGYADAGKWAATVEGGARFGSDLVLPMLLFNFVAILCQYLSARIAVVTGKDLSQICSEEYSKTTCIILGVLMEFSLVALHLAMILGIAHGFSLTFGAGLFSCVFLTVTDIVLFPVLATFLDNGKAKFLCILMAGFILMTYTLGVFFSQPEVSLFPSAGLAKLGGDSSFALMVLLGATIMPHNFFLHSSIVKQDQEQSNISKDQQCHDHLFATSCVFSGIFLVNYVLMNAAASVFGSSDLVLLTFQDALSLMDQVLRSPVATFLYLLVLFISSQTTALTWSLGRQAVTNDFFNIDIPGWLHHATIRILAVIIALYCTWSSGAEGIYQLILFTQVGIALVLPSSMIPLFRIAASTSVMGAHKISQFLQFLAIIILIGMLGLNFVFLVEMIFGDSDWVANLKWNVGSSMTGSYTALLLAAGASICLMFWLAATPLKSASSRLDAQDWNWDTKDAISDNRSMERSNTTFDVVRYDIVEPIKKQEPVETSPHSDVSVANANADLNLPETLVDYLPHGSTIEENVTNVSYPSPSMVHPDKPATMSEKVNDSNEGLVRESASMTESSPGSVDGGLQIVKTEEIANFEPEESCNVENASVQSLASEGPGSYRSIGGGRNDDGGSGAGSLSRLAGLGRAGRRQLAAALDEFWGQLFDFHGQATQEAKSKKLNVLLGIDAKHDPKPTPLLKTDDMKEFAGFGTSYGGRGFGSPINSSLYNPNPNLLGPHTSTEMNSRLQRGPSSSWSSRMQLLDAYSQNSIHSAEVDERRYSSLRLPPSSDFSERQPATMHGYQISAYLSQISKGKSSDYSNGQIEAMNSSNSSSSYRDRDPLPAAASGRRTRNLLSPMTPPGFPTPTVSRNVSLQPGRPNNEIFSGGTAEDLSCTVNAKKFHSMPDISGLALPYRNAYLSNRNSQQDSAIGYGPNPYPGPGPLAFDDISPSRVYRDPLTSQFRASAETGSFWSRQPFEQFGVAGKPYNMEDEGFEFKQRSVPADASSGDSESKLLQSLRHCIMKLLKLEGSNWLFRQNDGSDEDLIDRVAARERFLYEAETREMNQALQMGEPQYASRRSDEMDDAKFLVSSVPHCGEGCVWRKELVISFGVWCIRRVLELSLMESRPELWGKYTYVLNRLQGIIILAFLKPRTPMNPCFCLQIPDAFQQRLNQPSTSNASLPPPAKQGRGKCTTAAMLLELIKDVETAISCRRGRSGTAAGDVAFPKGKENLASVLKRYKRHLSNKPVGAHESGPGSRRNPAAGPLGL